MKLDDTITKRRSIRKFSSKKVKWDKLMEAIDAAIQAPFAGNINNLQFLIIEDQEKKNRLAECAQQDWIADASAIILVCSNHKHLKNIYNGRGEIYARQHAGAAIENFLLKITDLKLASCWVGAYTDDIIKNEFHIPKHLEIEAILPVGHIHPTYKIKVPRKCSLDRAIHWGSWGTRKKANS